MLNGEGLSPTILNPQNSIYNALKERVETSSSMRRSESAGPLALRDLEPNDDDGEEGEGLYDGSSGCGDDFVVVVEEDDDEEENEDELKAQFYRQQQLEHQQKDHDVDQFLARDLRFQLAEGDQQQQEKEKVCGNGESSRKKSRSRAKKTTGSSGKSKSGATPGSMSTKAAAAGAVSIQHEQQLQQRTHRSSQSNALLPDGMLHLWIFQARQLVFRQHFVTMYSRHGLHLRCYLSWRREYLSDIYESNRNVGGNMNNPLWRFEDDQSKDFMRGHFSIPLGCDSSPASLPANTELIIEIVCGILVVSSARVSLLEFFQDRSSRSSAEEESEHAVSGALSSATPQWFPLVGENAGLLEMVLEFIPASAVDDTGCGGEDEGETPFEYEASNNHDDDVSNNDWNLDETIQLEDAEPQIQDPTEPNAFEEEYKQMDEQTLTRNTRLECSEALEQDVGRSGRVESDPKSSGCDVVVSNNGKTTMYIPQQCRQQHGERSNGVPVQKIQHEDKKSSFVPHDAAAASSPSPQEVMIDEQVLDLYRFGISSDQADQYGAPRSASPIPHASQFPHEYSGFSERSEASMYSRKASTCATDVLSYNELIQDMEASLEAAAVQERLEGRRSSTSSGKSDSSLRHAAPTSAPNPTTAAMGIVSTKSALKKSRSFREVGGSHRGNSDAASSENDDNSYPASSVRETVPKGVVLFDLKSIPERLRDGFERSTSDDGFVKKVDASQGRRSSLPNNNLSPNVAQVSESSSSHGYSSDHNSSTFAIEEDKNEFETPFEAMLRRKRSSSLQSLNDLHTRVRQLPGNSPNRQLQQQHHQLQQQQQHLLQQQHQYLLQQQQQHLLQQQQQQQQRHGATAGSRSRHSNRNPDRSKRRGSNSNSVINVGGAVLGVGKFINVGSVPGVVRYIGPTNFATGTWIGIELCEKKGKNNGTVKGTEVRIGAC